MKRKRRKKLVEFSAMIDEDDYYEFIGHVPLYGSTTWFIRVAVREFNRRMRKNPALERKVVLSVGKMLKGTK